MKNLFASIVMATLFTGCGFWEGLENKAVVVAETHNLNLRLNKENRNYQLKTAALEAELEAYRSKNKFLTLQLEKDKQEKRGREIASIKPAWNPGDDQVHYNTYHWSPSQLLSIGEKEFSEKNYVKSAQFFWTYLELREKHQTVDDQILFQSGLASYESGKYYQWSIDYLDELISKYPTSPYFRGAKLWRGLAYLKKGDKSRFYETVEEFRLKYKNTPEWKILREHYEKFTQKFK